MRRSDAVRPGPSKRGPYQLLEAAAYARSGHRHSKLCRHGARAILNPGSVGQPRDGDPRAGYMLYDDAAGTVPWHRVAYDVAAAQRKIIAAGLPEMLAERLWLGV